MVGCFFDGIGVDGFLEGVGQWLVGEAECCAIIMYLDESPSLLRSGWKLASSKREEGGRGTRGGAPVGPTSEENKVLMSLQYP